MLFWVVFFWALNWWLLNILIEKSCCGKLRCGRRGQGNESEDDDGEESGTGRGGGRQPEEQRPRVGWWPRRRRNPAEAAIDEDRLDLAWLSGISPELLRRHGLSFIVGQDLGEYPISSSNRGATLAEKRRKYVQETLVNKVRKKSHLRFFEWACVCVCARVFIA